MTTTAKLHPALDTGFARRPTAKASGLTFGGLIDLLAKSIVMARAISDVGQVSARDIAKVRRLAETL